MRFPTGGERPPCKSGKFLCQSASSKHFSPHFSVGRYNKLLVTGPTRNIEGPGEIRLNVSLETSLLMIALGILRNRVPHCSAGCSTCMT